MCLFATMTHISLSLTYCYQTEKKSSASINIMMNKIQIQCVLNTYRLKSVSVPANTRITDNKLCQTDAFMFLRCYVDFNVFRGFSDLVINGTTWRTQRYGDTYVNRVLYILNTYHTYFLLYVTVCHKENNQQG